MITNGWRKSSHSHLGGIDKGDCVEAGRAWRKSSHSGGDLHNVNDDSYCVEAGQVDQFVALRDTKDRSRGMVTMSRSSFAKLLAGLK
jgi:hypothetical protein